LRRHAEIQQIPRRLQLRTGEIKHFQAKWLPVRVKKMRKDWKREPGLTFSPAAA
jgi:hypothetical protein